MESIIPQGVLLCSSEVFLRTAAQRAHKTAQEKGFDAVTWDNFPTKMAFVMTEVDEVVDETMAGSSRAKVVEEFADIIIRMLDIMETLWPGAWAYRSPRSPMNDLFHMQSLEQTLWPIMSDACHAIEAWRFDKRVDVRIWCENVIRSTVRAAGDLGLGTLAPGDGLRTAVTHKMEKNSERPPLNGKVRTAG